jgi:heme exporter protein A
VRMEGAGPAAVELEGLCRRFGRRWVLRGLSLRVEPGEVLALLGRNGSGKTTLLRVLATALKPTRGGGRIFGHDLVTEAPEVRRVVGLLGHAAGLYEDLTAPENLRFALRMMGAPDRIARIDWALDEVALTGVEERVRAYSAGMRRRLALARLLLMPPRLLLLDEPYASFDVDGIERVNAFVREVAAQGGAVIVVTHDLERARPVMDRVELLQDGELAAEGWDAGGAGAAQGRLVAEGGG